MDKEIRTISQIIKDKYKIEYEWTDNLGCVHRKCGLPTILCECEGASLKPVFIPNEPKY